MNDEPIIRTTLLDQVMPNLEVAHVEVRRISIAPSLAVGAHTHNGPVFGTIEKGSAYFQVGDGETVTLRTGDVFYEPANEVISKFDATDEGVTFLGYFPLGGSESPVLTMVTDRPDENVSRRADGSAGDADYGAIGSDYAAYRQPDPRIAAAILEAIGDAKNVLNVGAGAGSYEPVDRTVTAIEPSATMRSQRPPHLSAAIDATAESLPFADGEFDGAIATFTVHQWSDLSAGLRELRRVTTGPIVILSCDPAALDRFWLAEYAPEVIATEASRYPAPALIAELLGGAVEVVPLAIPLDCTDGFGEAYYGRPEALLDPGARRANSAWSFVGDDVEQRFHRQLIRDLHSGAWDGRHGSLRTLPAFDGSLRLIVGR
jgi:quercetin dioxygenase-like cupin family protein/SAM-dependent methyltransferase